MRYAATHKEETREKLIESSRALAKKGGFETTGVDALMKAIGLTGGAFYSHFRSKDELFAAIVERARERHPPTRGLIDCETAEGHALLALRVGIDAVIYKGPAVMAAKLAAIAAADGRRVVAERPPALALHRERDMAAACRRWLGDDPAAGPDACN